MRYATWIITDFEKNYKLVMILQWLWITRENIGYPESRNKKKSTSRRRVVLENGMILSGTIHASDNKMFPNWD
jgi:hypothetical protein